MARKLHRLGNNVANKIKVTDKHQRQADGGGLYLRTLSSSAGGGSRWTFMYARQGKQIELGLGSARDVPIKRARELAAKCRGTLAEGGDPRTLFNKPSAGRTFGELADAYIETHRAGWRNARHVAQWESTLRDYAAPLRRLPVDKITTEDVLGVLKPIWNTKTDTATRLRGRIEAVLDAAKAQHLRTGDNPARWRGCLKPQLAAPSKVRTVKHLAALPYTDIHPFMVALRDREGVAARALEFAILTAARSGEVFGARWDELDLDKTLWTVPAARIKAGKEHTIPLSRRAVELINAMKKTESGEFIFPGAKANKPLSSMAMEMTLRRMGRDTITVHGFRSTFRDWAGDYANFPREVCEAALAHKLKDKAEAAYSRSTAVEKRRRLMEEWAEYCAAPPTANVIAFPASMRQS